FSGVELQHQFADLGAQLAHLPVVGGLLVFGPGLQPALPSLHERVHPALDVRLLQVVLSAGVNERHLTLDQLQQQLDLSPSRPSLKVLLHPLSLRTRVLYPVQSERGTTSPRHTSAQAGPWGFGNARDDRDAISI